MNAIIVDDEYSNVENLTILLQQYCPQVNILGAANDVKTALNLINKHQPDLLFLDVQLGEETGFDLLRLLPNKNFDIIFITAFDKYGIEGIKFAALDYILKPVSIPELVLAVSKAEDKLSVKEKNQQLNFLLHHLKGGETQPLKIALPQLHEIRYIAINEIIRCEADNSYTYFYIMNGEKILVSRPIKEYAELLKPLGFLRSHQSHLVNGVYVKSWIKEDGGTLLLNNGDKIPVSKPNKSFVREALSHIR